MSNTYTFKLSSYGSARLYIDGDIIIENIGCNKLNVNTKEMRLNMRTYAIRVIYINGKSDGSGIELVWKIGDNNFIDISPNIYHVQIEEIEYTYQSATYYINSIIKENKPLFSKRSYKIVSITSIPSLPPGLHLEKETGIITGSPTEDSIINRRTEYLINFCFENVGCYSSKIYITIKRIFIIL